MSRSHKAPTTWLVDGGNAYWLVPGQVKPVLMNTPLLADEMPDFDEDILVDFDRISDEEAFRCRIIRSALAPFCDD